MAIGCAYGAHVSQSAIDTTVARKVRTPKTVALGELEAYHEDLGQGLSLVATCTCENTYAETVSLAPTIVTPN